MSLSNRSSQQQQREPKIDGKGEWVPNEKSPQRRKRRKEGCHRKSRSRNACARNRNQHEGPRQHISQTPFPIRSIKCTLSHLVSVFIIIMPSQKKNPAGIIPDSLCPLLLQRPTPSDLPHGWPHARLPPPRGDLPPEHHRACLPLGHFTKPRHCFSSWVIIFTA